MRAPESSRMAPDVLDEALDGRRGPEGVRQVAVEPTAYGVAELLDECLPGRSWALELLRTKFKPSRKLSAYYRISTGTLDAGSRHVAVTWFADTPTVPFLPAQDPEVVRLAAPFTRLAASSPDSRITVLVSPVDPVMPQLGRLTRPGYVAGLCEELSGRSTGASDQASPETVRYRPGQRHVLLLRSGGHRRGAYVKTDRDESGARAVPVADLLTQSLRRCEAEIRVVAPVGYSAKDSAAVWWQTRGWPLSRLLRDRTGDGARAVEQAGRALRVLHDGDPGNGHHPAQALLRSRDHRAEAVSTLRAAEHIAALVPGAGRTCRMLVSDLVERLDRLPAEAPTLSHGDFKADNLLVDGDRLTILDLDRVCWADPAMDLGKFLADLRWWCPAGDVAALSEVFRSGYGPCDPVRRARADLWSALFQLKLTARRCAVHDVGWSARVLAEITAASRSRAVARSA
jgi:aminoglycoside phosphotransferase (APT) family kinase protein